MWPRATGRPWLELEPAPILFLTERINISIHDQKPQELLQLPQPKGGPRGKRDQLISNHSLEMLSRARGQNPSLVQNTQTSFYGLGRSPELINRNDGSFLDLLPPAEP